jgi:hypothetical protein
MRRGRAEASRASSDAQQEMGAIVSGADMRTLQFIPLVILKTGQNVNPEPFMLKQIEPDEREVAIFCIFLTLVIASSR